MIDVAIAIRNVLRLAREHGDPQEADFVSELLALVLARADRDAEIRTLWRKLDYLEPGEREAAIESRRGWSRATIRRAIGPQPRLTRVRQPPRRIRAL